MPAIFPGVAENQVRLRFFLSSQHSQEQIDAVLDCTAEELGILWIAVNVGMYVRMRVAELERLSAAEKAEE